MNVLLIWGGLFIILAYDVEAVSWLESSFGQADPRSSPIHDYNARRTVSGRKRGVTLPLSSPVAETAPSAADGAEGNEQSPSFSASDSEGQLTTTFLSEISRMTEGQKNVVLNTFGIWSITSLIYSLSGGKTEKELAKLLNTQRNIQDFSNDYKKLYDSLRLDHPSQGIVQSVNSMFVVKKQGEKLKADIVKRIRNLYNAKEIPVNIKSPEKAAREINRLVQEATNNHITNACRKSDFENAFSVLLISAAYFNGKWKYPFNKTQTTTDVFKDDKDRVIAHNVPMMRNKVLLKYAFSPDLQSQIVELPYGDEKTSMLIFLPRRVPVNSVLEKMRGKSLHELVPEMSDEDVDIALPRFKTAFNGALNIVYQILNAGLMLSPNAEFPGLSNREYISRIAHDAVIDVNEEGTVAAAVTTAQAIYKQGVVNFQANRPFIYFINDMPTRAVLFAGVYVNPDDSPSGGASS